MSHRGPFRSRVYTIEIYKPERGWIHVGHHYRDLSTARSWLPFVRNYWRCEARVSWIACMLKGEA